jgi:hypothetical protein
MTIHYVRHSEIDFSKWDGCINQSINGIAYAYSWYLDEVAEGWNALVLDDYVAVLPLTVKRKFGVWYMCQPYFAQQLGVFSTQMLSAEMVSLFLSSLPTKIKLVDISLNIFTNPNSIKKFHVTQRVTYHLDLIASYANLYQKYSKNTQRNLAKAIALQTAVVRGVDIAAFLRFTTENIKGNISAEALAIMERLVRQLVSNGYGEIYGAYSNTNTLCATAIFVRFKGKSIYLLATSSKEGISNRAMFMLIDSYIQKHSGSVVVLDFEGSMIPGVAKFYKGFGACAVTYPHLFISRLPWVYQLLFNIKRRLFH